MPAPAPPTASPARWPGALAAVAYLSLAAALAGAVVAAGAPALHAPTPLVLLCALAAYTLEQASRLHAPAGPTAPHTLPALRTLWWSKSAAPALYIAAALLLPVPWTVVVAATAIVAWAITARISLAGRLATVAHTILVVTVFTVLARLWSARPRHDDLPALLHDPSGAFGSLARAWHVAVGSGLAAPRLSDTAALLAFVPLYYVLDTAPLLLWAAVARRVDPLRAWRDLDGATVLPEFGLLGLGVLAAVAPRYMPLDLASTLFPLLALPVLLGLCVALRAAHQRGALEAEVRVLRAGAAGLYASTMDARGQATALGNRLDSVLDAVRAIGGDRDLAAVTAALAQAATRLTPFQSATVYLYESRHGTFVPHASNTGRLPRGTATSRGYVERLLSKENVLGGSYYLPREGRAPLTTGGWCAGDILLVPLLTRSGDVTGYVLLDRPSDERVPTALALASLETVAFLAAGVITRLRHTDEVVHLAATDGLTGLLNRRTFEELLRHELAVATRRDAPLALLMIDVDDFGAVNNAYGHPAGDAALRLVAGVIREGLRESDAGGRYGGDEFAVILPGLDAAHAVEIAERLRAALIETTTRLAADGTLPRIHTSIGIASYPEDALGMDALVKAADDALYASKRLGKDRVSR